MITYYSRSITYLQEEYNRKMGERAQPIVRTGLVTEDAVICSEQIAETKQSREYR